MSKGSANASLLEHDVEIVGDILFSNNLYIHGRINGNIISRPDSTATLYIQEGTEVTGEIRANTIVIAGKVSGDIYGEKRVTVKASAEITGNIQYIELQIDQGASINGALSTGKQPPRSTESSHSSAKEH